MNRKTFIARLLLVITAFLLSQILLAFVVNHSGLEFFNPLSWERADSGLYLEIAAKGYELFPCAGHAGFTVSSTAMCGNTGWFPGYPLLIRLCCYIYNDPLVVAVFLSKTFYILSLYMVVVIAGINRFTTRNFLLVLIATFFFGFIYYNAIFPISALLFIVLSAFWYLMKDRLMVCGIFCFLAAFFYPTGFLLSVVFAIYILIRENGILSQKVVKSLIPVVFAVVGVLVVFLIFQITVGDWRAFIQVQAKYGHGAHNPIKTLWSFLEHFPVKTYSTYNFVYYQTMSILCGYIIATVFFFRKRMYMNELYLLSYIYITIFLGFPWIIGGDLSRYRAESLLLPGIFLLRETQTRLMAAVVILLIIIGIPMSHLFFERVLV